jgi:hypothetical protein
LRKFHLDGHRSGISSFGPLGLHRFAIWLSRSLPRRGSRRVARYFSSGWGVTAGFVLSGRGETLPVDGPSRDVRAQRAGRRRRGIKAGPERVGRRFPPSRRDESLFYTGPRHGSTGLRSIVPPGLPLRGKDGPQKMWVKLSPKAPGYDQLPVRGKDRLNQIANRCKPEHSRGPFDFAFHLTIQCIGTYNAP